MGLAFFFYRDGGRRAERGCGGGAGVRTIALDGARALVPSLAVDDALAAVWGPADGHASPNDVVQAYAARARAHGVRILEDTPGTGIRLEGGRVAAVATPAGPRPPPPLGNTPEPR